MSGAFSDHVWLIDLPAGWVPVPVTEDPDLVDRLVADTPDDVRPGASVLAAMLQRDRVDGAFALAWSGMEVAGTRLAATHTISDLASTRTPASPPRAGWTVLAAGLPVDLPGSTATLDVVVGHVDGVPVLEVLHTIEVPATGRSFRLLGRSPHVGLADQVVRMFHLMAATFEVVASEEPQPAVVRE